MRSAPTITFDYVPSRWLLAALGLVAALAVLAVALCGLPVWLRVLLVLAAVLYAAREWQRLRRPRWGRVAWSGEGGWRLADAAGNESTAELTDSRMLGGLIVLRLAVDGGGAASLVLTPDNLDADNRRRLRMRLSASTDAG